MATIMQKPTAAAEGSAEVCDRGGAFNSAEYSDSQDIAQAASPICGYVVDRHLLVVEVARHG